MLDRQKGINNALKREKEELKKAKDALEQPKEKLEEERDQAVMSLSIAERQLEENVAKLGLEMKKVDVLNASLAFANNAQLAVQRELDDTKAELLHLCQHSSDLKAENVTLTKDNAALKAKLAEVEGSLADGLAWEEELGAVHEVNYHGAWNNAILQIHRDNPGMQLDLIRINRYDDWVKHMGSDPIAGAEEDGDKER